MLYSYKTVASEALAIRSCIFSLRCFIAGYLPVLSDPSFLLISVWAEEYGMIFKNSYGHLLTFGY